MTKIKFGTDGWRAIIAKDYTVDNVKRVAEATAKWMVERGEKTIVLGHDTRFGGPLFAETTASIMGAHKIKVLMAKGFISTPMISLGVVKLEADIGVVITASHNPPSYNGYKLKSKLGGPLSPKYVAEIEALIAEKCTTIPVALSQLEENSLLEYVDLEKIYLDHVSANFDLDAIKQSNFTIAYDAMYGAGQNAMRALLPNITMLHGEYNPSFMGQAPEPIHRNLKEFSDLIKNTPEITVGIANDGDADRIGMYDEDGNFVDSHHMLLLLLYYMVEYKKETGKVVVTFSVTDKMRKLAEQYGLEMEITKIGFKYLADIMAKEDIIVSGEESGGLAVKGHLPERDGIWIGLMILEFMVKSGKSLKTLIQEVYDKVGSFSYDRDDLHLTNEKKLAVVEKAKTEPFKNFGEYKVDRVETIDGFKFYIGDDRWVMIRPSGTEPVLRVYAQAPNPTEVRKLLDATKEAIL